MTHQKIREYTGNTGTHAITPLKRKLPSHTGKRAVVTGEIRTEEISEQKKNRKYKKIV